MSCRQLPFRAISSAFEALGVEQHNCSHKPLVLSKAPQPRTCQALTVWVLPIRIYRLGTNYRASAAWILARWW